MFGLAPNECLFDPHTNAWNLEFTLNNILVGLRAKLIQDICAMCGDSYSFYILSNDLI